MDAVELHGRAAEAAAFGDDGASALRLVRAALALVDPAADPRRAAMLRERLARYLWLFSGDNEGAQRAYQEAVDLLPLDEPGPELAMALASLSQILVLRGRTAESIERGEQAIAMARRDRRARAPRRSRSTRWAPPPPSSATARPASPGCASRWR